MNGKRRRKVEMGSLVELLSFLSVLLSCVRKKAQDQGGERCIFNHSPPPPPFTAVIFASVMIRPANDQASSEAIIKKKADFIYYFLVDNADLTTN